ncbi:MAG: M14 family metallopeptidase, partial [Planctomycetia bacterium]|nr:M14 family metallopeptidase [Planctomycetia bacterium]
SLLHSLACLFVLALTQAAAQAGPLDGYADEPTWKTQLAEIDASELATVTSLGVTAAGRDVTLITIAQGEPGKKPAILIVGNVVAPHLVGSELATRIARSLIAPGADQQAATTALLEHYAIYIVPRPSPDASASCFTTPYFERAANTRPSDDDRDGDTDEDGPEDLNGDGLITMLRVEDVAGDQIVHPNDARLLIPADRTKHERGVYRLYTEGYDNDHDEAFNEDGPGGVEFHRNFPFKYRFFQPGVGPQPVSEPETRAVADFCFAHPNIALVLSFSPEDNLFHPWEADSGAAQARIKTGLLPDDAPSTKLLAERFQKAHGGADAPESATYDGSFVRWAYFHYGRWSLASRAWWPPKTEITPPPTTGEGEPPKPPADDPRAADQLNALRWLDKQGITGFVPWTAIEHPDFPGQKVEIGGFHPFVTLNPPAAELDPLAQKHFAFLTSLPEVMPRLTIRDERAESVGAGVFRVTALIVNEGQLPTLPEMGRLAEYPYPLQVTLTLPDGCTLITGNLRQQIAPLAASGGARELEWLLLRGESNTNTPRLHAAAPAVGEATVEIELK